ncbi:SAM-dependent methyltransferase [Streptomyces sp. NPDC096097]|uniref:SAM-dependent methyltransferase n=1 Tax=Streptomyces sp. NPDC096097 TaxID=3155546 RepID=UPI00332177AB
MAWRLLRALAVSRYEDITGEDSRLWDTLNRVLDDAVDSGDVRPLTAGLAVALGSLTDRASRQLRTGLTEQTRSRARFLLRDVHDRLRLDTQDLGLLRRLAWMTGEVADEVLDQAPSDTALALTVDETSALSAPTGWAGQRSSGPASDGVSLADERLPVAKPVPLQASSARLSAFWLGTRSPHDGDQDVARSVRNVFPRQPAAARINREHHLLITDALAQLGMTQILDLGCGYPANGQYGATDPLLSQNTHEVVQRHWRAASIIYVDSDSDVVSARRTEIAVTASQTRAQMLLADITDMADFLDQVARSGAVTRDRPVAVLAHDVFPWIPDDDAVLSSVAYLRGWLPPGSALSLTHATAEMTPTWIQRLTGVYAGAGLTFRPRDRRFTTDLFGDWEDLYGGPVRVVPTARHQPGHHECKAPDFHSAAYAGVAIKPYN